MRMFRVWCSTKSVGNYIVENTSLRAKDVQLSKLSVSDSNSPKEFHAIPDHIKKILYLDAPDVIVERDKEPIFSVEISTEAGTGHNVFQRFARLAASVENNVPTFYIYPEAVYITRRNTADPRNPICRWDAINPNVFTVLEKVMQIYGIPALFFYHPSEYTRGTCGKPRNTITKGVKFDRRHRGCPDSSDAEMRALFDILDIVIERSERGTRRPELINERPVSDRRMWMQSEFTKHGGKDGAGSPYSATKIVRTESLIQHLKGFVGRSYRFGELLASREMTVVYHPDAKYRGDPYPGTLAAVDYLLCRTGKTFEDRDKNLVLAWGVVDERDNNLEVTPTSSVEDFLGQIRNVRENRGRCLLDREYGGLKNEQIPRYYMQTRYGCSYTKSKDIRCYAYFADAILFGDGALWRDG